MSTWAKIPNTMPEAPAVVGLSDKAFRLYVSAICYCSRALTDGLVVDAIVTRLGGSMVAAMQLVTAGLFARVDGGFQVVGYLDEQQSSDDVRAKRAANAERVKRHRERQRNAPRNAVSNALRNADVTQPDTDTDTDTAPSGAGDSGGAESPTQRAQRLTKSHIRRVPMSNFAAVLAVVRRAVVAGFDDDAIDQAMQRLAADGRSVTVETLRIELEGKPAQRRPSTTELALQLANSPVWPMDTRPVEPLGIEA